MEVFNSITDFIDDNIRIVRYIGPLLAVVGASVLLHHTHAFTIFKDVNAIPVHIIKRNLPLRGRATDIINDRTINVQHLPIFFRDLKTRQKCFGEKITPINIALAGILPKYGCISYLQANLLHKNITIIPLSTTEENCLEAIVFLKKRMLSRLICINQDLVAKGLAVAHHNEKLSDIKAYRTLSKQLLAAEVKADKRGFGIWTRPTFKEKCQSWWKMLKQRPRWIYFKKQ